jgi:ferredoxin
MIMFYFSGTGNSKYIAELFCENMNAECCSIEEVVDFGNLIANNDTIAFCYPVYMSRVPRIMREFVGKHMDLLKEKNVIIFCTQLILSGDGARAFAALFKSVSKNYVNVIYAEHFFMPNNVSNMAILPIPSDETIAKYVPKSQRKMQSVCDNIKSGKVKKRGFNVFSRFLGLFQGVFLSTLEKKANNSVKVTIDCTQCGVCVAVCPMDNLVLEVGNITHNHNCTMCYRCINKCPHKAITVVFHSKGKNQYEWRQG